MKRIHWLGTAVFAILAYFIVFWHLDSKSVQMWDESRNVVNTMEMLEHGNPLVRTYYHMPDGWETKPPLLVWLQSLSVLLIGPNMLAFRLPGALASAAICVVLVIWGRHASRRWLPGYFMAAVFLLLPAYAQFHTFRTADHEPLITLWLLAFLYSLYRAVEGSREKKWVWLAALFVVLAVWTKSITGLMFLPGAGMFLLLDRRGRQLLAMQHTWLSVAAAIAAVAVYYAAREAMTPGYMALVWEWELWPRYSNTPQNFDYNPIDYNYYISRLIKHRAILGFWAAVAGFALMGLKGGRWATTAMLATAAGTVFLLIISGGTPKEWYDTPLLPLVALLAGGGFFILINGLVGVLLKSRPQWQPFATAAVFAAVMAKPYMDQIDNIGSAHIRDDSYDQHQYGYMVGHLKKQGHIPQQGSFTFASESQAAYANMLMLNREFQDPAFAEIENDYPAYRPGQRLLVCEAPAMAAIDSLFDWRGIDSMGMCRFILLTGNKTNL